MLLTCTFYILPADATMQKLLGTMAQLVQEVREDFNAFCQSVPYWSPPGSSVEPQDTPVFPLETMEDLERLEVLLQSGEKKKALVNISLEYILKQGPSIIVPQ